MASAIPKAGSVRRIDPAISSQLAPTSAASRAWRCTPPGWRAMTLHTMRISSWVLRSGARSESMEAIHAFWACRTPGASSCRKRSDGKGHTSSCTLISKSSSGSPGVMAWVIVPVPASRTGLGIARLAEDALRDHVALHLARAPGDGEAAGGEEALLPALRLAVEDRPVGAVERHPHLLHTLLVFHAEQLAHAAPAPGIHARERPQRGAVAQERDRLRLGDQVPQPLLHARRTGLAALAPARHGAGQRLDAGTEGGARRHGDALVGQRRPPDAPAVPRRAYHGVVGDEDVVEEDLVEHGGAGQLAQRPDVDALGAHVDDEVRDAGVLAGVGVRAGQADPEVRRLSQR